MTTWHTQDDPRIAWLLKVFNIDFFHKLPRLASVATILNFIPDASTTSSLAKSKIIKHKFVGPEGAGMLTWLPDSQTLVQENKFFRLFDVDGNLCSDIDDAKHAVMITPEWCNPSSYFLEKP
jgi:hypothetical protein